MLHACTARIARMALVCSVALATSACERTAPAPAMTAHEPRWGMVIHTGAGEFTLEGLGDRRESMQAAMIAALMAGHRILAAGGASLDAVQATIVVLEDSPLFNAGRGAVLTRAGTHELDASIVDGATHRAGAVAGVTRVKNPILLARAVMERSPHVMLAGAGADAFAEEQELELVEQSYFHTDRARQALERARVAERRSSRRGASLAPRLERDMAAGYFGTVGAVALDRHGNLAAGTSTGGMTNKRPGRVGDSPIVGAGTYASNDSCAISATGHGEYFIRYGVAHDICARVAYAGLAVQDAADLVVQQVLKAAGGSGGVIGIDRRGRVAMSFNVDGMGRGYVGEDGTPVVMFTTEDAVPLPLSGLR